MSVGHKSAASKKPCQLQLHIIIAMDAVKRVNGCDIDEQAQFQFEAPLVAEATTGLDIEELTAAMHINHHAAQGLAVGGVVGRQACADKDIVNEQPRSKLRGISEQRELMVRM